jgi:hypothetical protein
MKKRVGKSPTKKRVKKAGRKHRGYNPSRRRRSSRGFTMADQVCSKCGERFKELSEAIWHEEIKHRDPGLFKRIIEQLKKLSKKSKGGR